DGVVVACVEEIAPFEKERAALRYELLAAGELNARDGPFDRSEVGIDRAYGRQLRRDGVAGVQTGTEGPVEPVEARQCIRQERQGPVEHPGGHLYVRPQAFQVVVTLLADIAPDGLDLGAVLPAPEVDAHRQRPSAGGVAQDAPGDPHLAGPS